MGATGKSSESGASRTARPPKPSPGDASRTFEAAVAAEKVVALYHVVEFQKWSVRHGLRPRTRHWWRAWSWLVLTAVAAAAYGLAVSYDTTNHEPTPSLGWRFVDSLKLFPSAFPGYDSTRPWQYTLARYLAGSVFVLGSIRLLLALFSDHLSSMWAGLRSGHAVVCGLGETGRHSVQAFRDAGYRVTCLDLDSAGIAGEEARSLGALVLQRDATEARALQEARVDRAEYVVCSCPDDAVNTRVASLTAAVTQISRTGRTPSVHVHIDDPELASLLRGPLATVGSARFHFFNTAAVWARALLAETAGPFEQLGEAPPRIVVIGTTSLGCAVIVGAARRWHAHVRATGAEARMRIVVAGSDAADVCSGLAERYPAVARVCDLVPHAYSRARGSMLEIADALGTGPGEAAVYCCLEDQSAGLAAALDADYRLQGTIPVFLPATAAAAALGPLLAGSGGVHPVELSARSEGLDLLHDQMREALARATHRAYLAQRRQSDDFGSRPADLPWEKLDGTYRRANRRQVDGMVDQLQAVWFELVPRYDWDEPLIEFSRTEIEAMAELEHARWCRERREDGWREGPEHDPARKIHNRLVPWDELQENDKDLDRAAVVARPAMLAQAGFRLARDPAREVMARLLHDRYSMARLLEAAESPYAVEWGHLPESAREQNRAAVDDFPLKLAHIGCRAAKQTPGEPRIGTTFTPSEVELLAEDEHRRFVGERLASGWTLGARDERKRTNPTLVPWAELSEQEREKDREVVRAIPELYAAVGYTIIRERERGPRRRTRGSRR